MMLTFLPSISKRGHIHVSVRVYVNVVINLNEASSFNTIAPHFRWTYPYQWYGFKEKVSIVTLINSLFWVRLFLAVVSRSQSSAVQCIYFITFRSNV